MIADSIDYQELKDGVRSEGTYYGVLTLAYKMSQSFAIFILGIVIELSRFNPDLAIQSGSTRTILGLAIGFGCLIAFLLSVLCYRHYDLDREKVNQMQQEIARRRAVKR
jgi:Na+/melibiose symporter-like transporter